MKPIVKKIAIVGGLLLLGNAFLLADKVRNLTSIFDKMTIRPNSLPKNVKVTLQSIKFNIDIKLTNPTNEDFAVSGYVATLKKVVVYFKGTFLGLANVNLDEITVPRQNALVLQNVPIVISTEQMVGNVLSLLPQLQSVSMNDLQFTGVVGVLGSDYEIGDIA